MDLNRRGFALGVLVGLPGAAAATLASPGPAMARGRKIKEINISGDDGDTEDFFDSEFETEAASGVHLFFDQNGGGDGSSFDSPAAYSDLNQLISDVGPGGTIYGKAGTYANENLVIKSGGARRNPVRIRFVEPDMKPGVGRIVGNRTAWTKPSNPETVTDVSGWNDGPDAIDLRSGSDWLVFSGFHFERVQHAFRAVDDHRGLTIIKCGGYNVRRFLEHPSNVSMKRVRLKHIDVVGFSKQCIRIRGNSANWIVQDFNLDSGRQDRDDFAMGFSIDGTAHNLKIRSGLIENCHSTLGSYWNGDGIVTEEENYNILIEDVACNGHTDAGFDLKSDRGVVLRRCSAADNKKNYRFWNAHYEMEDCTSGTVTKRGGGGNTGHITTYENNNASPSVDINGLALVEQGNGNVYMHGANGSYIQVSNWSHNLSSGARIEKFEGGVNGNLVLG